MTHTCVDDRLNLIRVSAHLLTVISMAVHDNIGAYRRNRWEELIDLSVVDPSGDLPEVKFRLSRYKSLKSIRESYAETARVPAEFLTFKFDGRLLRTRSCAADLYLENGDVIHVQRKKETIASRLIEDIICNECSQPKCIPFSEQWWFG